MFSEAQLTSLEDIIQEMHPTLHVEEASLEDQHTLQLVLCNETICFRPLRIDVAEVDVPAALAGQPGAQQALQRSLRTALQGLR